MNASGDSDMQDGRAQHNRADALEGEGEREGENRNETKGRQTETLFHQIPVTKQRRERERERDSNSVFTQVFLLSEVRYQGVVKSSRFTFTGSLRLRVARAGNLLSSEPELVGTRSR